MCKACVQAVEDYFPDCPPKLYGDFLMMTTPFPAGQPSQIRMHLKEAKDAGCNSYKEAIEYAAKQMDDAFDRMKKRDLKRNKSVTQP